MKKLLILGGAAFQVPAILHALRSGCRVVTCDYLPSNPGHRYSHEYHNVSTTDCEGVLALAKRLGVEGVLAFASDPAAYTAAFVASEMGLPGNPPEAVRILTDKALFRAFQRANRFVHPRFESTTKAEEAAQIARSIGYPVMLKPVDSSGSKSVSRVEQSDGLAAAFDYALRESRAGAVIVEEWLDRAGHQIAGDGLVFDGRLVFGGFGDEHFDLACSPHAPVGESFPGHLDEDQREVLFAELQRLFSLLGIRNLVFNLDAMFRPNGALFILEVGPRAGGNCLPRLILEHTGVDLTDIAIRLALGAPIAPACYAAAPSGFYASWMIHSRRAGRLSGLRVDPELGRYLIELELLARPGDDVRPFASSRDTLGYMLFSFPGAAEMHSRLEGMGTAVEPLVA